ncbi:archease [Sandaracinus amylolyticus]|uniref:archease n=1 Tax=Sandaracinus amylolyticus TaxID=927083 RepID=UPI001F3D7D1F|nr:archease [Sandaracinus amylolyticus]UJR84101.1 Hypothetical protein I5071_61720 [Sandaracinus amylolyticus]
MGATHAFEEHVGEVRVRIDASTLDELFAEAGRAFAELACGELPSAGDHAERIAVRARDRDALLVALLDELVFRAEVEGRVYPALEARVRSDRELEATLHAAPQDVRPRLHVKAATLHGVAIIEAPCGVSATVVLDV